MAKVRARKETGTLYFDFNYLGQRFREQTVLPDTAINRRKAEKVLERIQAKILLDQFDYSEHFPLSKNIIKAKELVLHRDQSAACSGLDSGRSNDQPNISFAEFSLQWYEEMEVLWRDSHRRNVKAIIDSSLVTAFGEVQIDKIRKPDILRFRSELSKRPGRGENVSLSPKTVNSHLSVLKSILDEAAERFQFVSPFQNIKRLKLKKSNVEPFSLQEVGLILSNVREDFKNYYTVRFYTGLRTGEIDGLKWEFVDFERNEILIRETIVQGRTEYTKTDGSQRDIKMLGPVRAALKDQYNRTGARSEYVFCNRKGQPLEHNNVTKRVWYPLLRFLKFKKRRPYQSRHTCATLLLAAGESPEFVAKLLGHSSTEMLFKVYSRYIPDLTRKDGSAFEALLNSPKNL